MNFSVHIDQATAKALQESVERTGRPRNAIIREAVRAWLDRQRTASWPKAVLDHRGVGGLEPFEKHRRALRPPPEDPLR